MSDESNIVLSTEKNNLENEIVEETDAIPVLHSDEPLSTENAKVPAEEVLVQDNKQPIESAEPESQNSLVLGSLDNVKEDSTPEQQQSLSDAAIEIKSLERTLEVNESTEKSTTEKTTEIKSLEKTLDVKERAEKSTTSETPTEPKTLEKTNDVDEPSMESTKPFEILPSVAPTSDAGLKEVAENIQLIFEGLKGMKISTKEELVPSSAKKGRKPPSTPRARSTPVLTSPPLTRSRSRDLKKFPSTPSSPKGSASRKTSEGDSDEMKIRGRQRTKRN